MIEHFTLDEKNNVIPCSLKEWGDLYETDEGQLKRTVAYAEIGDKDISTVFLGLDHGHCADRPLLFETMIFDAQGHDIYMMRYTTWKEAEEGHKKAIQWVLDRCKDE